MAVQKTTWWDKDGKVNTGYIQDGKTYVDEALTERVPVGSTVNTNAGTYQMTSSGGVPTYSTARNNYENNVNKAIETYKAAGEMQKQRVQSATDAAIAEVNRQKNIARTNMTEANDAARKAYEQAANPFGALEEQRVRLGLDESGYSESAKLRLASDYAAQTNANLRAMNEQLQALDVQIAQAKASGQYELASIYEAQAQNIMSQQTAMQNALYSTDVSAIAQAQAEQQFNEQMAFQKEQLARQEAQAEKQNRYNLALAYLQAGASGSFVAETLGIPQKDVDTMIYAVQAANAKKASSKSGSGSAKAKISSAYDDIVKELWNVTDANEIEDMLDMYVAAKVITADEKNQIKSALVGTTPKTKDDQVRNTIAGMLRRGKATTQNITNYINSLQPGEISDDLLDELIDQYSL